MHTSVLLQQAVDALNVKQGGKYIDATYGEGGHSNEILKRGGSVLAFDWDENNVAEKNLLLKKACIGMSEAVSIQLIMANYADIERKAREYDYDPVDGVLFDLGLSMNQIALSGRGFSYDRPDELLDMRIHSNLALTAADIINSYSEDALYETFSKNAEEISSRTIAHAIVSARRLKKIVIVEDLLEIIDTISRSKQTRARIFQALRVEVNHEFENIRKAMEGAKNILAKDGTIVMISFHQSEDRIIKQCARNLNLNMKKPVQSKRGKRFDRSAKLRILSLNV